MKKSWISIICVLLLGTSLHGITLTVQKAHDIVKIQSANGLNKNLRQQITTIINSPITRSFTPGYSFEEQRAFVTTKFPFFSRLSKIKRYRNEYNEFMDEKLLKDEFYAKLAVNELFFKGLLLEALIEQEKDNPYKRNELEFEKKKTNAILRRLLQLPYDEPIVLAGSITDVVPKSIQYSEFRSYNETHIENTFAQKELNLEKARLDTLKASFLPNFMVTMEYWNDQDHVSAIVGFDFPILDSNHRALVKEAKKSVEKKHATILIVNNEVKIELDILIEEINYIVKQLDWLRDNIHKDEKENALILKARYLTLISNLNLLTGFKSDD